MTPPQPTAVLKRSLSAYLQRYHRHEIHLDAPIPDEPVLFVCNHGFGGVIDLNALALVRSLHQLEVARPVTFLVHEIAWTLGAGQLIEAMGGRPGSRRAVQEAYAADHHVAVFPGGEVDASKSWRHRHTIRFAGRSGYAKVAIEHGVPIVPIVTAGAGESLFVLSDGQWLARRLGLPKRLRVKAFPVSLSVPWGLNVGVAGIMPYAPLPAKLHTAVLAPVHVQAGESPETLAARVEHTMQDRLHELVTNRTPILG